MSKSKVVVHFQDGKIIKGYSADFFPNKERFHVSRIGGPPGATPDEVRVLELKAIFFVKDFEGDPKYNDQKEFDPSARATGRKIQVDFKDGEKVVGTTQGYEPGRPGFYLVPCDPESNNERCFVVTAAATELSFI